MNSWRLNGRDGKRSKYSVGIREGSGRGEESSDGGRAGGDLSDNDISDAGEKAKEVDREDLSELSPAERKRREIADRIREKERQK